MADQSKLQLFLLEMEQCNKQRKHRWWVHDIDRKHIIILSRNFNLMGSHSNNTSGWPENLKSSQLFGKDLSLMSYSRFPHPLLYESLHGVIQFDVSALIRNHMTYPCVWKRSRLFTCCSIFVVAAYHVYGILALLHLFWEQNKLINN